MLWWPQKMWIPAIPYRYVIFFTFEIRLDTYVTSHSSQNPNCTLVNQQGCGPTLDNGVDIGTYCCSTIQIENGNRVAYPTDPPTICCQYDSNGASSNSQCMKTYRTQSWGANESHCPTFCSYTLGAGVMLQVSAPDAYGRVCKATSDGRLVMSTPPDPSKGGWTIQSYFPAETCDLMCAPGYRYDGTGSSSMRCMIDYTCT